MSGFGCYRDIRSDMIMNKNKGQYLSVHSDGPDILGVCGKNTWSINYILNKYKIIRSQ